MGHKLAHLSHMNMEKFNPLTCSFSLQYHPWVTCKGHEKKGNDQQQKKFLIFKPMLLVNTCLAKDKLENFWQNFSRYVSVMQSYYEDYLLMAMKWSRAELIDNQLITNLIFFCSPTLWPSSLWCWNPRYCSEGLKNITQWSQRAGTEAFKYCGQFWAKSEKEKILTIVKGPSMTTL